MRSIYMENNDEQWHIAGKVGEETVALWMTQDCEENSSMLQCFLNECIINSLDIHLTIMAQKARSIGKFCVAKLRLRYKHSNNTVRKQREPPNYAYSK